MTTIEETIKAALEARISQIHTALPGIVVSYNASNQTADIRPAVQGLIISQTEDNDDKPESLPVVPAVPVVYLRGTDYFIHTPINPGDSVLLLFLERDPVGWRQSGDVAAPTDRRNHSLAHAIAIPGLFPSSNTLNVSGNSMQLGHTSGMQVEITPTNLTMGMGTQSFVMGDALITQLNTVLTAISAAFAAVTTGPVTQATQAAAASAVTAITTFNSIVSVPGVVLSTTIKGE